MVNCRSSSFLILMFLSFQIFSKAHEDPSYKEVKVGVILDMESGVGKVICRCITMALSDFYTTNPHYKTRIVFNTRDTKGEPLRALSSGIFFFLLILGFWYTLVLNTNILFMDIQLLIFWTTLKWKP